jgi:xanthine dehydrogenase small subunit
MADGKERLDEAPQAVRFVLDGEVRTVRDIEPTTTVLDYLREHEHRTGTKEGCAEGDCGACTVVVAEAAGDGRVRCRAVNSCIRFLPTLDGKALITVESLKGADGRLHPVQRAMVECHGSQCGFCTPGFVMSLFALYKSEAAPTRGRINDTLAGNLCRCTGYRPIIDAARRMYEYEAQATPGEWLHASCARAEHPEVRAAERRLAERLAAIRPSGTLALEGERNRYFAPRDLASLGELLLEHPDACILAGSTDVGLWVTKQHRDLGTVVYIGDVAELQGLAVSRTHIEIGAGVSLTDACDEIVKHYPQLLELYRRFASPPIRNAGTLGGNIANGSPIGDSMPILIALGASIVLRKGGGTRELALEDFYLAYQKTARAPGEFVERVRIPLPVRTRTIATYKISKRFDQDISAVCGAYCLELEKGLIKEARVAYGGMAATPKRAPRCEQALRGKPWSEPTVRAAMAALDGDYAPITDMRASREYRALVARNLLYRFFLETSGSGVRTRVVEYAE